MASRASLAPSVQALSLLLPMLLLAACGGESQVSEQATDGEPANVAGTWKVEGLTTVIGQEVSREIAGTVVLTQDGTSYSASFELETDYPSPDGTVPAQVVGTGQGRVRGSTMAGSAQTQIVASQVPGIDPGFTMVPATFGVRVRSTAVGELRRDGSIEFELENQGAEGERYVPTRTRVTGVRIAD